jgi:hypothetical protein
MGRLILVAFTGCALYVPIGTVRAQGRTCSPPLWTATAALKTATGQPIYVERPIPVPVRGGIALIGNPTLVWATSSILEDTTSPEMANVRGMIAFIGVVLGPTGVGTPILRPQITPLGTRMISPHVLSGRDSTLEVYWATAPGKESPGELGGSELWHANFDGAQWSIPNRVVQLDLIYWNDGSENVVRFARGAGVAAAASATSNGVVHTGIIYLRRQGMIWRESWIETGALPRFTSRWHGARPTAPSSPLSDRRMTGSTVHAKASSWSVRQTAEPRGTRPTLCGALAETRSPGGRRSL